MPDDDELPELFDQLKDIEHTVQRVLFKRLADLHNATHEKYEILESRLPVGPSRDFITALKEAAIRAYSEALPPLEEHEPGTAAFIKGQLFKDFARAIDDYVSTTPKSLSVEVLIEKIRGRPLWAERDRGSTKTPYEFFKEHYPDYKTIPLTGSVLRNYDKPLYTLLHVRNKRAETNPEIRIKLPTKRAILEQKYRNAQKLMDAMTKEDLISFARMQMYGPGKRLR